MAHFAKIGIDNIVTEIIAIDNIHTMTPGGYEDENIGINYLKNLTGHETWKKTSYNTVGGKHRNGGIPFRKNYAGLGFKYDSERDAFIPPKIPGFVLDEDGCYWKPPIDPPINRPQEGMIWIWDVDKWSEVPRNSKNEYLEQLPEDAFILPNFKCYENWYN
jgi:hypothetical protein